MADDSNISWDEGLDDIVNQVPLQSKFQASQSSEDPFDNYVQTILTTVDKILNQDPQICSSEAKISRAKQTSKRSFSQAFQHTEDLEPVNSNECDLCNKGFTNNSHLIRHKKRFHSDAPIGKVGRPKEETGPCRICNKTYSRLDSFKRHLIKTHRPTILRPLKSQIEEKKMLRPQKKCNFMIQFNDKVMTACHKWKMYDFDKKQTMAMLRPWFDDIFSSYLELSDTNYVAVIVTEQLPSPDRYNLDGVTSILVEGEEKISTLRILLDKAKSKQWENFYINTQCSPYTHHLAKKEKELIFNFYFV